jgi:topoisomerase-4 subunit B
MLSVTIAAPQSSTCVIDSRAGGADAHGRESMARLSRNRAPPAGFLECAAMASSKTPRYEESSIRVLKGLEPVRQRPGMYTRTDNPLHVVQEVVDNAADEALAGHGWRIAVTLHDDGSVSVDDDGRGIPFGLHPDEGVPVIEIVFTRLHAGGKFDKGAGGAYSFSGGLHGVGVSVTNALARRLQVTVWRDGQVATIAFAGGEVVEPLALRAATAGERRHGTRVRLWPDARYFDSVELPRHELTHLLRSKAVLLPGVTVTLAHEKPGQKESELQTWLFKGGLRDYLLQGLGGEPLIPLFEGEHYAEEGETENFAEGEGAAWCVAFTDEGPLLRESYVNLIPTVAGGTHEAGLKDGLFAAVKGFIEMHALLPKGVKLMSDDVFSRASFVLSARVLDPQFQGQIKERLNSRDALRLVAGYVRPALELWLNQHVEIGRKLADLVIRQAQVRQRAAQKVEKRKGSGVAVLPGKLTDCESRDLSRNEVFLVEGDSAGGSAKMGRDKETQAVLPLRGKVLNAWEVERDRLFANNEIHDIAVAIGVDPHGPDDEPGAGTAGPSQGATAPSGGGDGRAAYEPGGVLHGLRYGKVCILSDADVDGSHIQVLLLTLFFRHFPKLIERGHVHVARPPLYRVDAPARGKKPAAKIYALDDGELDAALDKLRKEGAKEGSWSISRFKGLGEMNAEQLWETTLNPDTRRLLPVGFGAIGFDATVASLTRLMGKGEAAARRELMELRGDAVEVDV